MGSIPTRISHHGEPDPEDVIIFFWLPVFILCAPVVVVVVFFVVRFIAWLFGAVV